MSLECQKELTHRALIVTKQPTQERSRVEHTKSKGSGSEQTKWDSRHPERDKGWERRRGTQTCRLCLPQADRGSPGRRDPHTEYRRSLRVKKRERRQRRTAHRWYQRGKEQNGSRVSLTLVVRFPRLDNRTGYRRATGGAHVSLNVHVLALPLRRDRLAERDCGRSAHGLGCERKWK